MKALLLRAYPQTRQLLREILQRRGHEVTVVEDADAACAAIQSGEYRLVIIETDVPDGDAALLCRRLRASSQRGDCLILAAGRVPRPEEVQTLLAAGADDYLSDLDDRQRLEARLAVAEHRVHTADAEDLTERRQGQETLRQSEERLRRVLENMPVMLDAFDADGRIVAWNHECERVTGYRADEMVGNPQAMHWLYPDDAYRAQMLEMWRQRGDDYRGWEWNITCKDGSTRTVAWSNISKHFLVPGWATWGIGMDVTQRQEMLRRLHDSEARYRLIADNVSDLIWMVRVEGLADLVNPPEGADLAGIVQQSMRHWQFSYVSPAIQRLLGYGIDQALSLRLEDLLPADSYVDAMKVLLEELAVERQQPGQRRERTLELQHRAQDGSLRDVEVTTTFWRDAEGRPIGLLGITRDITRRKRAEEAVRKEQQLLRHLLDLHERDRQLTAYEIHDGFSQYLTGALYNLQGFRELQAQKPQEAWAIFDAGLSLICRSIQEARRLIGGLRPPILDESGIVAAIDYLACEALESKGAEVEFVHDVAFGRLASPLESAIFRIVQESLTNARRHSQSAKIRIELRRRDDWIQIDVRDWGIGFDPTKVAEGRFGLQGIRERARLFGGQVSIETAPHQGTHVHVELPLIETPGKPPES